VRMLGSMKSENFVQLVSLRSQLMREVVMQPRVHRTEVVFSVGGVATTSALFGQRVHALSLNRTMSLLRELRWCGESHLEPTWSNWRRAKRALRVWVARPVR
jgi:hypothetical protein